MKNHKNGSLEYTVKDSMKALKQSDNT